VERKGGGNVLASSGSFIPLIEARKREKEKKKEKKKSLYDLRLKR